MLLTFILGPWAQLGLCLEKPGLCDHLPLKQNVNLVGSKIVSIRGLPGLPTSLSRGPGVPTQPVRARVHTASRTVCMFRRIASLEAYFQPQQMPLSVPATMSAAQRCSYWSKAKHPVLLIKKFKKI